MAHGARLDPPRIGERNLKVTPERYQKVKEVFSHACGLSDDERAAYLGHACADDPELRAEVEALLEHDQQSLPIRAPVSAREALGLDSDRHGLKGTTRLHELAFGECFLPERIGAFRIIRKIGQGGMGVVYEAEQDAPKRTIALKIIRPGAASEQVLRRFRFEAHVLGRLQHPGIAQVYEVGVAEVETPSGMKVEQPYFAMEYVRGKPLSELIPTLKWSTRQRLELFALICDAIHHAHQKGVIHRDLKPNNILIDKWDNLYLMDFGLAKMVASSKHLTQTGAVLGTPAYMAPEQWRGEPVDARTDVYALGVILYEMVLGQTPFESETPYTLMYKHLNDAPPPPRDLLPGLPEPVEQVILKALSKDREDRFSSAGMLAHEFGAVVRVAGSFDHHTQVSAPEGDPEAETAPESAPEPKSVGAEAVQADQAAEPLPTPEEIIPPPARIMPPPAPAADAASPSIPPIPVPGAAVGEGEVGGMPDADVAADVPCVAMDGPSSLFERLSSSGPVRGAVEALSHSFEIALEKAAEAAPALDSHYPIVPYDPARGTAQNLPAFNEMRNLLATDERLIGVLDVRGTEEWRSWKTLLLAGLVLHILSGVLSVGPLSFLGWIGWLFVIVQAVRTWKGRIGRYFIGFTPQRVLFLPRDGDGHPQFHAAHAAEWQVIEMMRLTNRYLRIDLPRQEGITLQFGALLPDEGDGGLGSQYQWLPHSPIPRLIADKGFDVRNLPG